MPKSSSLSLSAHPDVAGSPHLPFAVFGPALAKAMVEKKPMDKAFDDAKGAVLFVTEWGYLDTGRQGDVQKFEL